MNIVESLCILLVVEIFFIRSVKRFGFNRAVLLNDIVLIGTVLAGLSLFLLNGFPTIQTLLFFAIGFILITFSIVNYKK